MTRKVWRRRRRALGALICAAMALAGVITAAEEPSQIELKAWGVMDGARGSPHDIAQMKIQRTFQERNPNISLVPATGLNIPGRAMDTTPLMQIAGDISPAVIYVNFRQSDTYIRSRFLYPLDEYIEHAAGTRIPDGHLLAKDEYVARLKQGPRYASEFEARLAPQIWDVIRRECPYGTACPYVKKWHGTPAGKHWHIWALPQNQIVIALFYRRDLFAEAGLPDRVPDTMDELLEWARKLHNPKENVYGINISLGEPGWSTLSFLYSSGGRAVKQDAAGNWVCAFNSPEAVNAYYYVARLFLEPFENEHGHFNGVVNIGDRDSTIRLGMRFSYVDQKAFERIDPNVVSFGPIPADDTGRRGSEFNAQMTGIYAGYEENIPLRDAAWKWMFFRGGPESQVIFAQSYVENGLGRFVQPEFLELAGYPEFIPEVPKGWSAAATQALQNGIPEPYGRNCQMVYRYLSQAIDQIRSDSEVAHHIEQFDEPAAKRRIKEILDNRVVMANDKMLNVVPEPVRKFRARVAAAVALAIMVIFALVFRVVFRAFSQNVVRSDTDRARGEWQFGRYKLAYLILVPAMLSIALWSYWPLLRGTTMAFQDYNVRGFSTWVGLDNFGAVLFSPEFWHSMFVSLQYTAMFMTFGFLAPIILALLLSEVPRGKILFRTIFYLPAMLAGVVVIFLFKGFYSEYGLINQMMNIVINTINTVFNTEYALFTKRWLEVPGTALLCCMLPTIWAGMGPGCLIYLAALKGIPDDLYEAADIDGAGAFQKAWHITVPSLKALISINFIGAAIGCMQSGSGFILAMTGGGPYTPYPEFWFNDHILFQKYAESKYNGQTANAQTAWNTPVSSWRMIEELEPVDAQWVETFDAWRRTLPAERRELGHIGGYGVAPKNLRAYRKEMAQRFDNDVQAYNRAANQLFTSWSSIRPPTLVLGRYPNPNIPDKFRKTLIEWVASRPVEDMILTSEQGRFVTEYLRGRYTSLITAYNQAHGTAYAEYREVPFPERAPQQPGLQREDWETYVRTLCSLDTISLDETLAPAFQRYLSDSYATLALFNRQHKKSFSSFAEIPFPRLLPDAPYLRSSFEAFLKDAARCPIDAVSVRDLGHLFEEFYAAHHGPLPVSYPGYGAIAAAVDRTDCSASARAIRHEFTRRNYAMVIDYILLHGNALRNTVIYCVLAVLCALIVNPLAAYALSRFNLPGTYKILLFCMATMAFPAEVAMIPGFMLRKRFPLWPLLLGLAVCLVTFLALERLRPRWQENRRALLSLALGGFTGGVLLPLLLPERATVSLLNTFAALVLPGMANGYSIFLLKGFFDSQPKELYEAAELDGAGEWVKFWTLTMNLSKPILAVIALGAFTSAYSNFMMALIIIPDQKMWTLMVWIFQLQSEAHQSVVYASLVIAAIPTFLVFVFCQNIIMRGIVVPTEK